MSSPFARTHGRSAHALLLFQADAAHFSELAANMTKSFDPAFWDPAKGVYSTGTQMAQAAALWLDAVPASRLASVVDQLATSVTTTGITFGFLGVQ